MPRLWNLKFKVCQRCQTEKPIDDFYENRRKSKATEGLEWAGHDSYCKLCRSVQRGERREQLKRQAVDYLGGCCVDCGLVDIPDVYDFHHLDPMVKEERIALIIQRSWARVVEELKKCVLLCANCHRKRHAKDNTVVVQKIKNTKAKQNEP